MSKLTAAWLLLLCAGGVIQGQTARPLSRDEIRREDVLESRVAEGPLSKGGWVTMHRDDFDRLLSQLLPKSPGPTQPLLRHALYSATATADTLTAGRLQLTLDDVGEKTKYLHLGEPSLAVEELSWPHGPAIWGTAPNGKHWLKLHPQARTLEGRWTARGRFLYSGAVFELSLLPAAVSQLELLTPRDHSLTSDVGDVVRLDETEDGQSVRWRVSLGSLTRCRLMLSPQDTVSGKSPVILYKQELAVAVSSEELLLRQDLFPEVLDGEIDRCTVSFPRQVEIASVTYGDQTPLKFERIPGEGPAAQLIVWLPETVRGRTRPIRPIRLEGFVRRTPAESLTVPQFHLENGYWLQGAVNISVARPWELRSFRASGYRQSSPSDLRSDAETIKFQQLIPRAQLVLDVERPAVERTGHALNLLTTTDAIWTLTAEIAWESRSGTVYDASCRLPAGWQVVSVVQLGGDRELQELAGWEVQPHPESGQRLRMEFSEGLTPGRVDPVRIIAHRSALAAAATHFPMVVPTDCESTEVLFAADASAAGAIPIAASPSFEPFDDPQSAAPVWNTLRSWSRVLGDTPEFPQMYQLITNETAVAIPPAPLTGISNAAVQVTILPHEREIREHFEIELQLTDTRSEIELAAPHGLEGVSWNIESTDEPIVDSRRTARPSPNSLGETWKLELPMAVSGSIKLIGDRTVSREPNYIVPLVFVPLARRFHGRVVLTPDVGETQQLREVSVATAPAANVADSAVENLSNVPREWTYRTAEREWRVEPRGPQSADAQQLRYHLTSLLTAEPGGDDHHQLRLESSELTGWDQLRFRLAAPAAVIAVLQAGQPLPFTTDGSDVAVTGWEPSASGDVAILYRIPASTRLCRLQHLLATPQLARPCTEWIWDVCLPPRTELQGNPLGLPFDPQPSQPGWFRRVWGPLSRSPRESLFPPWPLTVTKSPAANTQRTIIDSTITDHGLIIPADRAVYRTQQFGAPWEATFDVWNRDALRQATWAALLGTLPLGFWLRRVRGHWQNRLTAAFTSLMVCLAVFGPFGWNGVFGGASSGLLVSCLLPRSLGRLATPSGGLADQAMSTQIFHKAAFPFVLWIAFGDGGSTAGAQDTVPSVPQEPAVAEKLNYQVLVPVDAQHRPSQILPVVYVSPALHEALLAMDAAPPVDPVQLIGSAEYIVSPDQHRRLALKVKYKIDLLPGNDRTQMIVPLSRRWTANLESCAVDGRLQSAILSPEGTSLVVPMEPRPADADLTADPSEQHEVLLNLRLPTTIDPLDGVFEADVLPVLNSRLTWQSPERLTWFELSAARGEVTASLDGRLVEGQLGGVDEFEFHRGPQDRTTFTEAVTDVQLLQLLTLHPMLTQVSFRAECRVVSGGLSRMDLDLPSGAVLRDVRGHKFLQTSVQPPTNEPSRVILEFQEPQRQNFVVEGEYILPRTASDQNIDFPHLKVRCGKLAAPQRDLAAVACESGFSTQMINLDDAAVLPMPIGQFVTQWGDTVPNQFPRFAFQVQDGGQPTFRLAAVQPEQQLVSFREDVTLSSRKLDWVLNAELKSTSPSSYSYTVLLDRRLTIEQISLKENNADRLLRWTKTPMPRSSQNRITLFLNRESSGNSQLQIRGGFKVRTSSPITLPSVRFETAQSIPGILTLSHEAGHRLDLEGRQVPVEGGGTFPDLLAEPAPLQFFKRLRIQEGDSGLIARLEPAAGACRVRSLWQLNSTTPQWTIRGRMEITPEDGTREVQVAVPDWLGEARLIQPVDAPAPVEISENGRRQLQLWCDADSTAARVLVWETEVAPPDGSVFKLALPTALHASQDDVYAAQVADPGWMLDSQPGLPVTTLSDSLLEQLTAWDANRPDLLSQVTDQTIAVHRVDHQSPDGLSSVALVEHHLQGLPDGSWQGQSEFRPQSIAGTIEIIVPKTLEILGVVVDGQIVSAEQGMTADRRWRIRNAGQHHALALRWRTASRGASAWPRQFRLDLPQCLQERSPTMLVTLSPSEDNWLMLFPSLPRRSRWELSLERFAWLLQRHRDAKSADEALSLALWHEYRTAAASLPFNHSVRTLSETDRRRWETVTHAVSRIPDPGIRPAESAATWGISPLPSDDERTIFAILPPESTGIRSWQLRRDVLNWAAAGVVFTLGWWLLPFVVGLQLSPRIADRRHAGWFLFGTVWWLCLSPSIVGFAIMAWSILGGAWQRRLRVVVNQ